MVEDCSSFEFYAYAVDTGKCQLQDTCAVEGGVEALRAHRRADPRRFGKLGRTFGGGAAAPAPSKL